MLTGGDTVKVNLDFLLGFISITPIHLVGISNLTNKKCTSLVHKSLEIVCKNLLN